MYYKLNMIIETRNIIIETRLIKVISRLNFLLMFIIIYIILTILVCEIDKYIKLYTLEKVYTRLYIHLIMD